MKFSGKGLSLSIRIGIGWLFLICGTNKLEAQDNQPPTHNHLLVEDNRVWTPYITNSPSSVALKTNILYGATLTPNLALEIGLGKKTTLEFGGGYNFYEPSSGKHWKHWLVQPEFRYWFCERFNGTFLGIHALGGEYNFAKINLPLAVFDDLKDYRYEGHYYGGGISIGYQWILGKRWNFEASVGAGYVRVHYDKYRCTSCGSAIDTGTKNYWGPTKATISLLFFL
ncbi:DUF3575 domain-containing protein [Bacteroides sp. 519]|uniref:DUF3575 domain-containing protein n=1 Tax=Bacteroides sp. 519 TaxID=2302937 RepID=UPI0013D85B14|nr:DUF3575 domain-containing protein [Bacteroides sp. 519]NDV56949.1 DUF3575 domain-containing protein [Bacteroides sp. 519]